MFISCKDRIEYINLDNVIHIFVFENYLTHKYELQAVMINGRNLTIGIFDTEEEAKNYAVLCLMRVK